MLIIAYRYFKYYRIAALYHVIEQLHKADLATRLQPASLITGALAIYMINAIIYRPAEGRAEQVLLETACQHQSNLDGSTTPILYGRGLYFLADIAATEGIFQLPSSRQIDPTFLMDLYRRDSMDEIEAEMANFHAPQQVQAVHGALGKGGPIRTTKSCLPRKRRMTCRVGTLGDNSSEGDTDDGEGSNSLANGSRENEDDNLPELEERIRSIKRQFPSDILQLAPTPRSSAEQPWLLLNQEERNRSKISAFKSLELIKLFRQAQYKVMADAEWHDIIFLRYFPPQGRKDPDKLQNFPACNYYREWQGLMAKLDEERAHSVQDTMFKWFNELCWVPHATTDRMWDTKKMISKQWRMLHGGEAQNCPRLAINPTHYR